MGKYSLKLFWGISSFLWLRHVWWFSVIQAYLIEWHDDTMGLHKLLGDTRWTIKEDLTFPRAAGLSALGLIIRVHPRGRALSSPLTELSGRDSERERERLLLVLPSAPLHCQSSSATRSVHGILTTAAARLGPDGLPVQPNSTPLHFFDCTTTPSTFIMSEVSPVCFNAQDQCQF